MVQGVVDPGVTLLEVRFAKNLEKLQLLCFVSHCLLSRASVKLVSLISAARTIEA